MHCGKKGVPEWVGETDTFKQKTERQKRSNTYTYERQNSIWGGDRMSQTEKVPCQGRKRIKNVTSDERAATRDLEIGREEGRGRRAWEEKVRVQEICSGEHGGGTSKSTMGCAKEMILIISRCAVEICDLVSDNHSNHGKISAIRRVHSRRGLLRYKHVARHGVPGAVLQTCTLLCMSLRMLLEPL